MIENTKLNEWEILSETQIKDLIRKAKCEVYTDIAEWLSTLRIPLSVQIEMRQRSMGDN